MLNNVPLLRALKMLLNFDIGRKAYVLILSELKQNVFTEYIKLIKNVFLDAHNKQTFILRLIKEIDVMLYNNKITTKEIYKEISNITDKQVIMNMIKQRVELSNIKSTYKEIILNLHDDFFFDIITRSVKIHLRHSLIQIFFKDIFSNDKLKEEIKEEIIQNKYQTLTIEFNKYLSKGNDFLFEFNDVDIEKWWFKQLFSSGDKKLRMKKIMINCIEEVVQIPIDKITNGVSQPNIKRIIVNFKKELNEQDPTLIKCVNVFMIESLNKNVVIKLINHLTIKKPHKKKRPFNFDDLIFKQSILDKYKRSKEETLALLKSEYSKKHPEFKTKQVCINIKKRQQPNQENEKKMISFFHDIDKTGAVSKVKKLNIKDVTSESILKINRSKLISEIKNYSEKNNMRLSQSLNMRLYLINLVTEYKYNDAKMKEYTYYSIKVDNWHELLEEKLENFFKEHEVSFITENDIKNMDRDIYNYSFYKSPDIVLLDDVYINGKLIRWVDAKNLFGNSLYKSQKRIMDFNKQVNDYVDLFGPGAIVFGHGYSTDYNKLLQSTTSECIKENFDRSKMNQVELFDGLDILDVEYILPWSLDIESLPSDQKLKDAYGNKISYIDPKIL